MMDALLSSRRRSHPTKDVMRVLATHHVESADGSTVEALTREIRWAKRHRATPALRAGERKKAVACVRAMIRHRSAPPRRPGATADRRVELIELLDHLNAAVRLSVASGFSVAPVLDRLRS